MTYPNAIALARQLQKPLVCFDIEHSGGKKEVRGITELAALVVTPAGQIESFGSLLNPGKGIEFVPLVSRMTGIWPNMLWKQPKWPEFLEKHLRAHQGSIWVGYNSRSSDSPVIRYECHRHGITDFDIGHQLDVLRLANQIEKTSTGSLSARVSRYVPDLDVSGAHRAAKDALMTLALLDALLPLMPDDFLSGQDLIPRKPKPPKPKLPRAQASFTAAPGERRIGATWQPEEEAWLKAHYAAGQSVESLAERVGRSVFGIASRLVRLKVLPEAELATYSGR